MDFCERYQGFAPPGHNCRMLIYPDGSADQMVANRPIFGRSGWEAADDWGGPIGAAPETDERPKDGRRTMDAEGMARSRRRAKARLRQIARATPSLIYFVTWTLSADKVDRYDVDAANKRLTAWLSNQVQRRGLTYIVVPEYHKDGAIHWHGLINDALDMVDSGTIIPPGGGKPRRPRSKGQRVAWLSAGGQVVYNLPGWGYGYTTAIRLYGERDRAINYVAKYISKSDEMIGGRWYRHGGNTGEPMALYLDTDVPEGTPTYEIDAAGLQLFCCQLPPGTYTQEVARYGRLCGCNWHC